MFRLLLSVALLPLLAPCGAIAAEPATEFTAKVIGVIDGDTIDVLTADKTTVRLRLNGIDAPERGQPFGNNAKQYLSPLVGHSVRVVATDRDRYGRTIAEVYSGRKRITLLLVRSGLAWHYVKYSADAELAAAEVSARKEKRGLWSDSRHVAPWDWRKLSKAERDKLR